MVVDESLTALYFVNFAIVLVFLFVHSKEPCTHFTYF